uniref:KIB1-4 beta-propeller domain-containing protein n=1 Tax=Oryza meridionalis TaxID=40149 RepID=A0A0E0DVS2_9ORYZ
MDGSRQEMPPPTELSALGNREVAAAEKPFKKTCHSSVPTSSTLCEPHVWPGLLESLLHQIIALLSSFQDLLAFSATCHSWRAALSSFPSVYTFNFPPLCLKLNTPNIRPLRVLLKDNLLSYCKWQLDDPSKRNISLRCSAPPDAPNRMRYLGCSYGYLIFSYHEKNCLFVDAYTGTKLKSPKLNFMGDRDIYYGILTAPLNSPNSHLILCSRSSIFYWQVGTNSWTKHVYGGEHILQIVLFKGEIFAMDVLGRLHTMQFAPQLSIQEAAVLRREEMVTGPRSGPWLVACGEMLLMVDLSTDRDQLPRTFQVFRLEFSAETVECVKMERLENQALFVNLDGRDPTFSCTSPERWGGKSNWIYVAKPSGDSGEPWTAVEFGQPVPSRIDRVPDFQVDNMWVVPSLIYDVNQ